MYYKYGSQIKLYWPVTSLLVCSQSMAYSFTHIECPTVSDYKKYGELHILRCSLEGPILTPNYCEPVTIECGKYKWKKFISFVIFYLFFVNNIIDSVKLTHNSYKGQVSIEFVKTESSSYGPLEVFLDGRSGEYVCYDSKFTKQAADSACRQLGYTGSLSYIPEEK